VRWRNPIKGAGDFPAAAALLNEYYHPHHAKLLVLAMQNIETYVRASLLTATVFHLVHCLTTAAGRCTTTRDLRWGRQLSRTPPDVGLVPNVKPKQLWIAIITAMGDLLKLIWYAVAGLFRSRAALQTEVLALRDQLNVLGRRAPKRVAVSTIDRLVFAGLYHLAPEVLDAVKILKPETIIRWHRAGFRAWWRWKSRPRGGRPRTPDCKLRFKRSGPRSREPNHWEMVES
jgi:hypothetical protein